MGLLDRLFGRRPQHDDRASAGYGGAPAGPPHGGRQPTADEQAIERYRYLLRTAPPDQIEQAHAEAFAQLTPEQRAQVLGRLSESVPAGERPAGDDPRALARAATRAELRQPGFMERTFSGPGPGYGPGRGHGGPGMGGIIGGSMLGTIGGLVVGTAVADALFDTGLGDGGLFGGGDDEAYAAGYEDGAGGFDDPGAGYGGGDWGGDFGGDFGGGDFGGGDF